METNTDIAKNLIDSMDSNGVVTDSKKFKVAVRLLGEEFDGDVFGAITYLVDSGMDEDIAHDLTFKYVEE